MRLFALVRRIPSALRLVVRRVPAAFTLIDRLFVFRTRYREPGDYSAGFERVRLQLVALEPRALLDGRPLPAPVIFVGSSTGSVRGYDAETADPIFEVTPYGPGTTAPVHVATGDFTGDGYPDAVTALGAGGIPLIHVLDGHTGAQVPGALGGFLAFDPTYLGGVSVAAADVDGDGIVDVVAAGGPAGGPEVRVFSGADEHLIADFFVTGADFAGGITVAAADLTGDGKAEIAVGAGPGGAPRVSVYNPLTGGTIDGPLGSFLAFDSGFTGGVAVGSDALSGDLDGDGVPDLAVGTGPGVTSQVRVFSGATGGVLLALTPFGTGFTGGVSVGLSYVTDDPHADVVVGTGPAAPAAVRVFDGASGDQLAGDIGEYAPFGADSGGVSVATSNDPSSSGGATITGAIWYDEDLDGVWDPGEHAWSEGTVYLSGGGLNTSAPTWGGHYEFDGLAAGSYQITFEVHAPTNPPPMTLTTAGTVFVDLGTDAEVGDIDLGVYWVSGGGQSGGDSGGGPVSGGSGGTGAIGDFVWDDLDRDGVQDAGEPGAPGVTVFLSGPSGPRNTVTDGSGHYTFSGLDAGTYTVDFVVPPGFGISTPSGAEVIPSITAGEYDDTADVGLIPPPGVGGRVIVALKGDEFDGAVATVRAPGWATGDLAATIEWGDGTSSAGTLTGTGGTYTVSGEHTYTHEGYYAMAVRVSAPGVAGVRDYAAGLADVLAPTDHLSLQHVGTASADGGGPLDQVVTVTPGGFTARAHWSGAYTLSESAQDPGATFDLSRSGAFGFTLNESGSDFSQPDSGLSLTASESSTRSELIAAPDRHGTATEYGTLGYTLVQTGTGADYTWGTTGTTGSARYETVTVSDGTYTAVDGTTATLTGSGRNDAPGSTYWESESGAERTTRTEAGYHGPVTYGRTRTETGTASASESGGFWDYSFARSENHGGAFTLTEATSTPGGSGTASGSGTYSDSLTGNGTDPGGSVSYVTAHTDAYAGTATATLSGAVTTSSATRTGTDRATTTGSESTGAFTLVHATTNGATTTATEVNQGVTTTLTNTAGDASTQTETGSTGAGAYTLTGTATSSNSGAGSALNQGETDTWSSSGGTSATSTQTGDRLTGAYTLHQTGTTTSGGSDGSTQTAVQTGGGVTGRHALGASDNSTGSQTTTTDRTGNLVSGSYSLHETSSTTGTETDTSSDDTDATGTLGSTEDDDATDTDRATATGTSTLDRTGNALSGTYSLHQVSSSTATETDSATEDISALPGDGEDDEDRETDRSTAYQTSGSTVDRTGNDVSGTYSQHVVSSSSGSSFGTSTDSVNDHAANDSEDDELNVDLSTVYQTSNATTDRTGNAVTGGYSQSVVETDSGSAFDADTDTVSDEEADGEDDEELETSTSSAYQTSTSTATRTGNDVTGAYSQFLTATDTGSSFETATTTVTDDLPDGSEDDDTDVERETDYQTSNETLGSTGNEVTGSYSEHEVDSDSGSEFDTGTDSSTDDEATGEDLTDLVNSIRAGYRTSGATLDRTGNFIGGGYSVHEVDTESGSAFATSTDSSTDDLVDGEEDDDTDVEREADYQTSGATIDQSGSDVTGAYSVHEVDSDSDTDLETGTDTSTDDLVNGGAVNDLLTRIGARYGTSGAVIDRTGNGLTGAYSVHEVDTDTGTDLETDTDNSTDALANGSEDDDSDVQRDTDYQTSGATIDESGDAVTGVYSVHEIDTDSGSEFATGTDTETDELADGDNDTGTDTETSSAYHSGGATVDRTGSGITGGYSVHEVDTESGSAFATSTDSSTDDLVDGEEDDDTDVEREADYQTSGATIDQSGSDVTGAYSVHEVDSDSDTDLETGTDTSTDDLVNGGAVNDLLTRIGARYGTSGAVIDRTGNGLTGAYSVHEVDTDTGTDLETDTDNSTDGLANGSEDDDSDVQRDTDYETSNETLDRTGNEFTGTYSEHEVDSASESEFATGTDTETDDQIDGEDDTDTRTDNSTAYQISGSTADRTGNDITGAYSAHEVDSGSGSEFATGTDNSTDDLADGSEDDDTEVQRETNYQTSGATIDRTGNELTGAYSVHEVDTGSGTALETGTGSSTDDLADGSTQADTESDTSTDYETSGATIDQSGNRATGAYSEHEVDTGSGTEYGSRTDTEDDELADGGDDSTTETDSSTAYQTSGATIDSTGNSATGAYSVHEIDSNSGTDTEASTNSETDELADGEDDSVTDTGASTAYHTSGATIDRTGNAAGAYSMHEVDSSSGSEFANSTDSSTDDLADGSEDDAVDVERDTVYQTAGSTVDESGDATGAYSVHEVDSSSESESATDTDTSTDDLSDGSEVDALLTRYSTRFGTSGAIINRFGNSATGAYSAHEVDTESGTALETGTGSSTDDLADGSTQADTESDTSTDYETSGATIDQSGNEATGAYSVHEVDTGSATDYGSGTNTEDDELADGGDDSTTETDSSTAYQTSGATIDSTGNSATGAYSVHEIDSGSDTDYSADTDSETDELADGPDEDKSETDQATVFETSGATVDRTGNSATGAETVIEVDSDLSTTSEQDTDRTGWDGTTVTDADTATDIVSGLTTTTRTGNSATGAYSIYETGSSDPTDADTAADSGLAETGTVTAHSSWTYSESGNSATGTYTLTRTSTDDSTTPASGTDARGTFTATATAHAESTTTESGNRDTGTSTATVVTTSTTGRTASGGAAGSTYSQTASGTDASTAVEIGNSGTGETTRTTTDASTATSSESGSSPTTGYTLREVDGSSASETYTADDFTGVYTLVRAGTSSSSLTESGSEGTADTYALTKTTTGSLDTTRTGESQTGEYTISGTAGSTSTAIESLSHGGNGATFTEILTDDSSQDETGNDQTGEYELTESGTRTADFRDDGADGSGSFQVTEGSSGTYDRTTDGDRVTGSYGLEETSTTGYSFAQVLSGGSGVTLIGSGTDAASASEAGDTTTGDYSRSESGADDYDLNEYGTAVGGSFSQWVLGTDTYASTETGNKAQSTFDRTTTGGGAWGRSAGGAGVTLGVGSGTNAYTLTETGDALAGHFSHAETGTDRYGLVDHFDDVSNTESGATPGNVTFHSHGLPFRDPGAGDDNGKGSGVTDLTPKEKLRQQLGLPPINDTLDTNERSRWEPAPRKPVAPPPPAYTPEQLQRAGSAANAPGNLLEFILKDDSYRRDMRTYWAVIQTDTIDGKPGKYRLVVMTVDNPEFAAYAAKVIDLADKQTGYVRDPFSKQQFDFFNIEKGQKSDVIIKSALDNGPPKKLLMPIDMSGKFGTDMPVQRMIQLGEVQQDTKDIDARVKLFEGLPAVRNTVTIADGIQAYDKNGDAILLASSLAGGVVGMAEDVTDLFVVKSLAKGGYRIVTAPPGSLVRRGGESAAGRVVATGVEDGPTGRLVSLKTEAYTLEEYAAWKGMTVEEFVAAYGKSCFAAGTPLLTSSGAKKIEDFQPGDVVLSRDEHDPEGPVTLKVVEEVFCHFANIIRIHVGNQIIGTTVEHPFWVQGKGWLPARELMPGDRFAGHDNQSSAIDRIVKSDEWGIVYNLRVADFHTYFVGCDEWGFSVWAHNTCYTVYEQHGGGFSVRYAEKPGAPTKWATEANGDVKVFAKQADADAWVASHKASSARTPIPGDADYTAAVPAGSWKLTPDGMGAHMVERVNVRGRPAMTALDQADTPRFYPTGTPENAGQAHIRIHAATKNANIALQGGNPGMSDAQLIANYKKAYSDPSLNGIRGDLRTPDGKTVIAKDVTPAEAFEKLMEWKAKQP